MMGLVMGRVINDGPAQCIRTGAGELIQLQQCEVYREQETSQNIRINKNCELYLYDIVYSIYTIHT